MSRSEAIYHRVVIWVLLIVLMLPLLATLVYALVLEWGATILPSGFTLKWLVELWSDPRFLIAHTPASPGTATSGQSVKPRSPHGGKSLQSATSYVPFSGNQLR